MSKDTAHTQAAEQVASIVAMVAALNVDYDRLEELRDERADFVADYEQPNDVICGQSVPCDYEPASIWSEENPEEAKELAELEEAAGDNADREEAENAIMADPLNVEVRSGWQAAPVDTFEPEEFRIVLCTGGPHVELVGDIDRGTPSRVRVLYRYWGTSGEYFPDKQEREALETYCAHFYFGE